MTRSTKTRPLAAYVRVSRIGGREGEGFISPDVQRDDATRYALSRGFSVAEDRFDDLDVSGATPLDDRPALAEALRSIESGSLGGLVVSTQDRLARDLVILRELRARLKNLGAVLLVADNPSIEDDQAEGFASLPADIRGLFDEALRGEARKRFKVARREAVERGIHVASRTPTGYVKGSDRRLVPHPAAAPIVAEVFRRRAAGASLKSLAALLQDKAVAGPYKAAIWTSTAVSKVLKNRVYRGEARSGEFVNLHAHPAIVTEAEWLGAQSPRPTSTPRGEGSLLAGLLRCAGCGYVMKADKMTDPRSGERVRIYRCRGEHAAGTCSAKASVMGRVIEPFVADALFASGRFTALSVVRDEDAPDQEALLRAVETARRDLSEYLASDLAGVIGAQRFREGVESRKGTLDDAEADLTEAGVQPIEETRAWERENASVKAARDLWATLSTAHQRDMLARLFDAVVLRRGRVKIDERAAIFWRGTAPTDLPRRGKRVGLRPIALGEAPSTVPTDAPRVLATIAAAEPEVA